MNKLFGSLTAVGVCLLLMASAIHAQTDNPPRYEAGAFFSALTLTPRAGYRTEVGVGGRFTFNLNPHVALEAETTFFPNSGASAEARASGRAVAGLFGVKAGRRWEKFGVFAKARPGLISFSQGQLVAGGTDASGFSVLRVERVTHFAFDLGGVLEFYPTRRIVTRFDVGDTIIRYGTQTVTYMRPQFGAITLINPSATRHNFQVSAGIGLRFD